MLTQQTWQDIWEAESEGTREREREIEIENRASVQRAIQYSSLILCCPDGLSLLRGVYVSVTSATTISPACDPKIGSLRLNSRKPGLFLRCSHLRDMTLTPVSAHRKYSTREKQTVVHIHYIFQFFIEPLRNAYSLFEQSVFSFAKKIRKSHDTRL